MLCPQCHSIFTTVEVLTLDQQKAGVDECYYCGGHFLPSLIANFISEESAKNLDSIRPKITSAISLASPLHCPICNEVMTSIRDDSVPLSVTIFACPENHGHFFPKNQLFAFKKAQSIKIDYHQIWGIPLKSAFAILLPVIAIFTIISILPLTLNQLKSTQESRISAHSLISTPLIVNISPTETLISFTTPAPTTSFLTLINDTDQKKIDVSTSIRTTHTITLKDLTPQTTYSYTITTPQATSQTYTFTTVNQ